MDFWTAFITLALAFATAAGSCAVSVPKLFDAALPSLKRINGRLWLAATAFFIGAVFEESLIKDAIGADPGVSLTKLNHALGLGAKAYLIAITYWVIGLASTSTYNLLHSTSTGSQPDGQQRDETAPEKPAGES
ncbi:MULTISPECIES: hypothetical protein [unclassified Cupriavidus]|uniref:hypothetical protein n=1 Tax=unclassified Cupriavidus TaxID=2640874 RepID=UPI00313A947D